MADVLLHALGGNSGHDGARIDSRVQQILLFPQFRDEETPAPRQPEDAIRVQRVDEGLAALADEPSFGYAEAVEESLAFRRDGAQFTVRRTSGRSSEKAGMAMLKSSPLSFCIWYVPTMIPEVVGSGQPLV